jgi:hypothetical protein
VSASAPRKNAPPHLRIHRPSPGSRRSSTSLPSIAAAAILATLLAIAGATAAAAQASGASAAFGLSAQVTAGPVSVAVPATPTASGQAPPAYDRHGQVASASASAPGLGTLVTTGIVQVSAASTLPSQTTASAAATVDNLGLVAASAIRLDADTVASTVAAGGACGSSLNAVGTTTIEHGRLTVSMPVPTVVDVAAQPAPNTTAFNQLGVRIVLNEQVTSTGATSASVSVNAIHVYLTNALLLGSLLNGDIVVAHAAASLGCAQQGTSADLDLTLSANPVFAVPGKPLTVGAIVQNTGPDSASGVVLQLSPPHELVVGHIHASQGSCSSNGSVITCNLGDLGAGATASVTLGTRVARDACGTFAVQGEVRSDTPDTSPGDNSASLMIKVNEVCKGCAASAAALLLDGGRFRVEVEFRSPTTQLLTTAQAVQLSDESGFFWFSEPGKPEVFTKVLDACTGSGQVSILTGGVTDLELVERVTDLATGATWEKKNPSGQIFTAQSDGQALTCHP